MKSDAPQLALPQAVAAAFAPFPGKPRPLPLRARLLRARAWQQRRRPKQRKERRGDGSWPRGVTKGETKVKNTHTKTIKHERTDLRGGVTNGKGSVRSCDTFAP